METENKDWKPEVGKTAWYFDPNKRLLIREARITGKSESNDDFYRLNHGLLQHRTLLYPTVEAALASIKIYDLEGKEVVITRAIHFSGICSECGSSIAIDGKQANAMDKPVEAAYNMELGDISRVQGKRPFLQEIPEYRHMKRRGPEIKWYAAEIPRVKQIPMRTIEEQNVMLSPDGERFLIDKQEYFDWCLRNEDMLCMFLDSKIRGGAAIGGKSKPKEKEDVKNEH